MRNRAQARITGRAAIDAAPTPFAANAAALTPLAALVAFAADAAASALWAATTICAFRFAFIASLALILRTALAFRPSARCGFAVAAPEDGSSP